LSQVRITIVALLSVVYAGAAFSQGVELDLGLSEIYSSNILLVPDDEAVSDFVTRINPSLSYSKQSQFVDLLVDYDFEALFYADNSILNQNHHQLAANMLARLIGDQLTASADAIYTQVDVDPLKPQTDSNINVTGNRTDGLYLGAGLQWLRKLPLKSEIDASYTYGTISYDDPGLQEVDTQTITVSIASDSTIASPLTYEFNYNYWFYDYETTGDIKDQNLALTLNQEISYGFDLLGLVGLDSDFSDPEDPELSEWRWEAGFETSNDKGHLLVMFGHRYFGNVLRLSAGREVAGLRFSASYSEEPGTAESVFLSKGPVGVPDEDESAPPEPPPSGTDQPGSGRQFIYKRADGGMRWEGYNSGLGLVVWWDQRNNLPEDDIAVDDTQSNRDESFGAWLGYDQALGERTTGSLWASMTLRTFEELVEGSNDEFFDHEIDTWRIGAGVSYEIGKKTDLATTLSYLDSSGDGIPDNYDEFQAKIELKREF